MKDSKMIINMLEKLDKKSDKHGERLAAIEEHLKTLNGKVARNIKDISDNREDIDSAKVKIAKWGGALAVGIIVLEIAVKYFLG